MTRAGREGMPSYPFYLNPSSQTALAGTSVNFLLLPGLSVFGFLPGQLRKLFQKSDLLSGR